MSPYQQVLQIVELQQHRIQSLEAAKKEQDDEINDLKLELAVLKTKQAMWSGGIAAIITIGLSMAKNWIH